MAKRSARAAAAAGCAAGLLIAGAGAHGAYAHEGVTARPTSGTTPSATPIADETLQSILDFATRDALREGEEPVVRRTRLLERIRMADGCFIGNPTAAQLEAIASYYGGRNPSERIMGVNNRFFLTDSAWDGSGAAWSSQIGQAKPISLLTYSFPNDGVLWGPEGQLNRLSADLIGRPMEDTSHDPPLPAIPGPGVAYGRELFRQVLAGWQRTCSVRYMEVCDDDAPWSPFPPSGPGTHGDIRFGSYAQGEGLGVLAFNYFPEFGGDMVLNSSYFVEPTDTAPPPYFSASNGYRYLRNTIAHEHGHGLGFRHVIPCSQTKLMEPFSSTVYDMVQIDEKRGAQHNYGDRFAGNQTRETARDLGLQWIITPGNPPTDSARYPSLGNANDPVAVPLDHDEPALGLRPHSVLERDLSTNGPVTDPGTMLPNPSGEDWFKFTIENPRRLVITVTPTGGSYVNGEQVDGSPSPCSGPATGVDALAIGNLDIQFFREGETTPFRQANGNASGVAEMIDAGTQPAGTYYIRVFDSGGSSSYLPDQPTQLYDLSVRLGPDDAVLKYPPYAIAGVDKYAPQGQYVQFIGDLLSRTQDPNSEPLGSRTANFEWDLDGDGTFEINIDSLDNPPVGQLPNNPRFPFALYTDLNRIIPVTLRVTDPIANLQATDTIFVTVTGSPIAVTAVTPAFAYAGTTIPITISGSGLGAVMALNQIALSGMGVTLGGTPLIDPMGTTITGLTISVDANAPLGARNLRITDGCTAGFLNSAITILEAIPAPPNDTCGLPDAWTAGPGCKPFDNRGATTDADQDFTGSGCEGSTLYNDVWCVWTASQTGMLSITSRSNEAGAMPAPFPSVVAAYRLPSTGPIPCPPALGDLLACGESFTLDVQIGDRLLFRIGSGNDGQVGMACVDLAFADLVGSCCNANTGACTMNIAPASCNGIFDAANVCSPNPCPQPLRRCCYPSGQCSILTQAECIGGDWNPTGTTCANNPCPQPTGACCHGDGACTISTQINCAGSWTDGGACAPNPCPQPLGSCCLPDGQCVNAVRDECGNGVFSPGVACTPASCQTATSGSCCLPDAACEITLEADCPGDWVADGACDPDPCMRLTGACCTITGCAITTRLECTGGWSAGAVCDPDPCAQPTPGVCCAATGDCTIVNTAGECTGTFNPSIMTCAPGVCPPPRGACCDTTNGLCTALVLQSQCTTGGWHANTACSPTLCPPPSGVCCIVASGVCTPGLTPGQCNGQGGAFLPGQTCTPQSCPLPGACCATDGQCSYIFQSTCFGTFMPGQTCLPNPCAQPTGACCDGTACTIVAAANCMAPGVFKGSGTVCGTPGNPTTCCPANFNGVDGVSVQDIFDFLNAFFAMDPSADFNGMDGVSVQDIFDFLGAYFTGCPSSGGACCSGTTCVVVTGTGACTGGGVYQGDGVVCGPTGNPTTCCPANLDGMNGVSVQDLFVYLTAWQLQAPVADFNGDGSVTLEDLFDYLRAYFAGCPG